MDASSEESHDLTLVELNQEDLSEFKRLDLFLGKKLPHLSRSFLKKLFEAGMVSAVDDQENEITLSLKKMPSHPCHIEIIVPPPIDIDLKAQNIPLSKLYEDEHLIFINKDPGLVVHPAPGHPDGTLVNALMFHCPDIQGVGGEKRPGIVHRLDKGTSGVMVAAKTQACHEKLVLIFQEHAIDRIYEAITLGVPHPMKGTIQTKIGRSSHDRQKMSSKVNRGKEAITHYEVIQSFERFAHVRLKLETGRTHQIRVHLAQEKQTPILMDGTYGQLSRHKKALPESLRELLAEYPYPLLHAKTLGLIHPITGKKLFFEAPLPNLFQNVMRILKK